MRAFPVSVLLCVLTLKTSALFFPEDQAPPSPSPPVPCRAKDGSEGRCVSLMSGGCLLYRSTTHLLLRKPAVCSLTFRDAIVCCPMAALSEVGGGVAPRPTPTPRATRPDFMPVTVPWTPFWETDSPPVTPPPADVRPPPRPVTPATSPPRPQTPPAAPDAWPTPLPDPVSSTRDLNSPIGLRPRPVLEPEPAVQPTLPHRGFRQPGCGINHPMAAYHSGNDYFQQPPPFSRSQRVVLGLHPWMAIIGERDPVGDGGHWTCAGALLTPHIVITSAQCVLSVSGPERLVVGLGEHDLTSRTDGVAGTHAVLEVRPHPAWAQPERRHSLALLLLSRAADPSPLIQPVCLPPPDPALGSRWLEPLPGSRLVEAAYDLDSTGMSDASARNRLAATEARVAPLSDCVSALAAAPLTEFLFPGGPQAESDLCLAAAADCALDVGAPVVAVGEDGRVQLEGIQLLGSCVAGQPRLLLRVRHYVPFIADAIEKMMEGFGTQPF